MKTLSLFQSNDVHIKWKKMFNSTFCYGTGNDYDLFKL
jgi:hypothetical protein